MAQTGTWTLQGTVGAKDSARRALTFPHTHVIRAHKPRVYFLGDSLSLLEALTPSYYFVLVL